ncbi:hypothetical protein BaRGS_00037361 [Batillaria attramentaria]|uniref:ABC transporter n=1 Tax=Batillaria attramentaria TaxID=370345 RepID=A0ABD0JA38_9CAEN
MSGLCARGYVCGCSACTTARLTARIRNTFFAVVMKQDLEFFCEYQTGDLVSRLMTATGQVGMGLSPNLDQFLRGLFTTIGVMLMMVETSWRMCMLPVILLPALVGVSRAYGIMSRSIGASSQQQMGDMSDLAEEKFSSMVTVRSFAMEDHEITRFARLVHGLYDNGKERGLHARDVPGLGLATLLVCTIVYGGHLIEGGLLTGGDLVTVVLYLNQISSSIQIMNAVYSGIMKGVGCSQLVFEPLCRLKQGKSTLGSVIAENVRGEIEFRDVTFSFTNRPHVKVLNEVSFRVAPGEMVALVGPSGGGKSTCMALLQNFYQPRAGHVTLDGIPVALVDQEPALFACSVRDNIRYGFSGGSDTDVISAARQAHAHDFVCAFPDGYETSCGERGLQMSGGQKQRLAIARALIRRPKVLILDETTSALDCQTEAQVQATVNSLRGQCTVLWIAHHLNTVHIADRVLVLDKGRLVEQGTPSDLLARGGLFADLVRQQLGNVPGTGTNTMMSLPSRLIPTREDIDMKDKGGQSRVMVQKDKKRARVNKEEEGGSRAFDVNSGHYGSDVENGGVPLQKRAVVLSYRATAMQVADSML